MSNALYTRCHVAHDLPFARVPSSHHDNPSPAPIPLFQVSQNGEPKFVYQVRVFFCMLQHVRAGTYNRHITFQNIYKLRQFVHTRLSHNLSDTRFTRIVFCGLKSITLSIHPHRTELITPQITTILTTTFLLKENRTGRTDLNRDSKEYIHEWENCAKKQT